MSSLNIITKGSSDLKAVALICFIMTFSVALFSRYLERVFNIGSI
ncbi:hypothetical protein [Desulfoplanes formicivorans]|nr:hypothetical protein [Desulfoplanes formicivorans]